MTFEEFRQNHDHYNAYSDWITVREAKASGLIPEAYHEYFPDDCECGSENIIRTNLKAITCCDPKCYLKEALQMAEFFSRSNIERLGEGNCRTILNMFHSADKNRMKRGEKTMFPTGSFLDIFDVPENLWPLECGSAIERDLSIAIAKLKNDNVTFPELISRLGIESLGSNALKLFDGISSAEQFKQEIDRNGGVRFFCYSRGVYSLEIINSVYESLIDIANAERLFHNSIRQQGLVTVDICITGSSVLQGISLTKNQLVEVLNQASIGKSGFQYFEFHMCTALQSAPFILYTTPSSTAKFRAGQARGTITDGFGEHPVLMQIDDFYDLLIDRVNKLDEEVANQDGQ